MLSDLTVLYRDGLVNVLTFDPLSDNTAACDGRPTTKRLEARVYDVAVVINPDLKLHDVTARGSADKPSSDVRVALVCGGKRDSTEWCESKRDKSASRHLSDRRTKRTNVPRFFEMIHHLHVDREQTDASPGQIKSRMWYERGYSASTSTLRRSFLTAVGDARSCGSFESEAHVSRLYHFYNAREVLMLEKSQTSSKMLHRCRKENRDTSTGILRPHKSAA